MSKLLKDFRDFVLRGNVIDLAVAVVIGVAFNAVVNSLVNDVIMPLVGAIFGKPNFDQLVLTIGDGVVHYGKFLTAVVNLLIIAATLFVVVQSYEKLRNMRSKEEKAADPTELDVLLEIRDALAQRQG